MGESDTEILFKVTIEDKDSSIHKVILNLEFYKSLSTHTSPSEIVRKSFEFLLKREPKESILSEFDLRLISNYFPEYLETAKTF